MANGYLGKISAIVSANTGDFQAKLNASAKDVQSFARSVQSNLTAASRDAARAFEGIYTPLQKFERSLQAASTMKLSFKGFAGAIRDVDALRQRLSGMKDSQLALVLKTTGLKNITEVREALMGLKSRDLSIVAKVGGIEKVRELRALSSEKRVDFAINLIDSGLGRRLADAKAKVQELKAAVASVKSGGDVPTGGISGLANEYREATAEVKRLQEVGRQTIKTTLGVNIQKDADVDRILKAGERAEAIRLPVVLDVLGEAAVKDAVTQSQRLRSVAEQINKPFGEAVQKISAMSIETQAGLLPAFKRVQAQIESLNANIEKGVLPASAIAQQFDIVERRARAATDAANTLAEAEAKVGSMKTGRELAFSSPQLSATLDRGVEAGNRAAAMPASVIQENPRIAEMLREINTLSSRAVAAFARLQSNAARGVDTTNSQRQVDALRARLDALLSQFDETYQIHVDAERAKAETDRLREKVQALKQNVAFTVSGSFANADQIEAEVSRVTADFQKLDGTQKAAFGQRAMLVIDLLGENKIQDAAIAVKNLRTDLDQQLELKVTTTAAQKAIEDLNAKMEQARERNAFVITGRPQNMDQADARKSQLEGEISGLNRSQRQNFKGLLDDATLARQTGELEKYLDVLDKISYEVARTKRLDVETAGAEKKAKDLKALFDSINDEVVFRSTGQPQTREQAEGELRSAIGRTEGLDPAAMSRIAATKNIAVEALGSKDIGLGWIRVFSQLVDKEVQAKKAADDLRSVVESIGAAAGIDRLRKSVQDADTAVQKLGTSLDKTKLEGDIGRLRVDIGEAARIPAGPARDEEIERLSASADGITQSAGRVDEARTRIGRLNEAWGQAIRGLPETEDKIDAFFTRTMADVGKLNLADRISLDPLISEVMSLIQTGAGVSTVTAKMLELEAATNKLAAAGSVSAAIEKLSPSTARNDLDSRLSDAKAAATSPIQLAAPGDSIEDIGRETEARSSLGKDLGDSSRQVDVLRSSITSLKSQIDTLPEGVRSRFIPAIRDAENELVRLSAGPAALPRQIEAARQRVQQLAADAARATQAMSFRQSFGGAGASGVNLGLDQRSLQGYNAQLQVLQGAISRASAEARGPAVAAFEALRNAVATAFDEGRIDAARTREELALVRQQAVAAAAAASRIRVGSLTRDVARAGDIGRGGFDKFSLAANQAAFAVDDFLSSTGGMEFKLRAISNNITQLAFVLGGTYGLFIGLGAVIAGQVALGLIKWANNGRTAEDQTKALNEALARQKSLVDDLAQSFKSLADEMSRSTLSSGGQQARDIAKQLTDIRRKQKEVRESRIFNLDPNVQRERAQQVADRKKLEGEDSAAQRIVIARQIRKSEERERGYMNRLQVQPAPSGLEVSQTIARAATRVEGAGMYARPGETSFPVAEAVRAAGEGLDEGSSPAAIRAQIAALDEATRQLEKMSEQTIFGSADTEAQQAIAAIEEFASLAERLSAQLEKAIDEIAVAVINSARGPSEQIRQAQEEVAKAIEAGLPGARVFGDELDSLGDKLSSAFTKLESVLSGKDADGNPLGEVDRERLANEARAEIEALQSQRAAVAAQADAYRYERTVDPQRQIDARMGRATSNLSAAGLEGGRIARRMREIENERETIRQRATLPEFQTPEMRRGMQDVEDALNEEAAALEAATISVKVFADALNRASEEAKGNLNTAQQAADEARRADLAGSTPQTRAARRQAEADLERQREIERAAQTEIEVERDRLEQRRTSSPEAIRMQQIDEELRSGTTNADQERERLKAERAATAAEVNNNQSAAAADVERARRKKEALDAAVAVTQRLFDKAAELTGEGGKDTDEALKRLRDAGYGDVADELFRLREEAHSAADAFGEIPAGGLWDSVKAAADELEAAIANQATVVAAGTAELARLDAAIAAAPEGDRESLIREREKLRTQMENDARTSQARVDESTREAEQAKAAIRGRELVMTPEQRFAQETDAGLEAIRQYYGRKAEDEGGLVDFEAQRAAENRYKEEREKEARTATSAGRGRQLGMTDRERFRQDMAEGPVRDITEQAWRPSVLDLDERRQFLQQAIANQVEQVAPMLKGFEEERQNALMQGPSRAALVASDVSTSQGQSELNRLLRGDDASKDVNLAELKKQTERFDEMIKLLRDNNPGVLL